MQNKTLFTSFGTLHTKQQFMRSLSTHLMLFSLIAIGLCITAAHNFLLFHLLAEFLSIIISIVIFVVAWNYRHHTNRSDLVIIGFSCFFVAIVDFSHVLTYNGMQIFSGFRTDLSMQLWVVARLLQSSSFVLALLWSVQPIKSHLVLFSCYSLVTIFLIYIPFNGQMLLAGFIGEHGTIVFKQTAGYISAMFYCIAVCILYLRRTSFYNELHYLLIVSLSLFVIKDICFTALANSFWLINVFTLLLKIIATYLIYIVIKEVCFIQPVLNLLDNLTNRDTELENLNKNLEEIVKQRTKELLHKQHQLEVLNNELEHKVQERTLKLENSVKELALAHSTIQAADKAKSEFLADISHEIRTPMNAVSGMIHLALKTDLTSKQNQYLQAAASSAKTIMQIINNVLDISKIEAGKLEFNSVHFDIAEVLSNVEGIIKPRADSKGIKFIIEIPEDLPKNLTGDPLRLKQVLLNLCTNAVKFTEKGQVLLTIYGFQASDSGKRELTFSVTDTGSGMTVEQIALLFTRFNQINRCQDNRVGSTGIGLSICKKLIELQGGKIRMQSIPGKGTTISFTIPFGLSDVAITQNMASDDTILTSSQRPLAGAYILVVDDDDFNRQIATELLHCAGAKVDAAQNGSQALKKISTNRYDVVLLDIRMPEVNGYEVTRILRQNPAYKDLSIIAFSANAFNTERDRCLASGMNDFIAKPFSPQKLYQTLARWVSAKPADKESDEALATSVVDAKVERTIQGEVPEELPGISISKGLAFALGNKAFYHESLQLFYESKRGLGKEIKELTAGSMYNQAAMQARAIKAAAITIGAEELSAAAWQLEKALDTNDKNIPEVLMRFEQQLKTVLCGLKECKFNEIDQQN